MRTLARPESGLVLTLVLVVFLFVELVVVGGLSLVMSDLQGAVAGQLAMQSLSVAEAGVNYGVAQLVERAALATDQEYAVNRKTSRCRGPTDDLWERSPSPSPVSTRGISSPRPVWTTQAQRMSMSGTCA